MIPGDVSLPAGLHLRPARPSDNGFIESLYRATRDDLRLINAEDGFVEALIDMQYEAQTQGYATQYPNAMYFIAEKLGERIGRVTLDFGPNEVRVVDIAFIPAARGQGYGTHILRALQQAAAMVRAPLTLTVHRANLAAKRLYLSLGFRVESGDAMVEFMAWYPGQPVVSA